MAKQFFTNFRASVDSFPLGEQKTGFNKPGRYNGFQQLSSNGGLNVTINHNSVVRKTGKDNNYLPSFGALMFPTGQVFHDDEDLDLTFETNSGNANTRIDYVIAEHTYKEVSGGTPVYYSIIKGPLNGTEPTLTNPNKQVLIGKMTLVANGFTFADMTWTPEKPPLNGDLTYQELVAFMNSNVSVGPASISTAGITQYAKAVEVQQRTLSNKSVTPAGLLLLEASETDSGFVIKAKASEVQAGTNNSKYVTPKDLKDSLPLLSGQKESLTSDKILTAADNGKIFIANGSAQINITVPAGLPTNFHVGVIWANSSAKFVSASGVSFFMQSNKLPEPNLQYNAILLESSNVLNNFFVLGNLKTQ